MFYTNMNGLNYRNAVVSNGLASQQSAANVQLQLGRPEPTDAHLSQYPSG